MRRAAVLVGLCLGWTVPVHAQPASTETSAEQQADELIRSGVELRKEGRESEALEHFRKAYELQPTPRARAQMGLAAKSLRRHVEAERYLEEALAAADDPWVRTNREALELAREVVGKQLASLMVHTNIRGAALLVNGGTIAKLPLDKPVRVPAGAAVVQVRASGYEAGEAEATLPAGTTTELRIDLALAEPPRAEPVRAARRAPRAAPAEEPHSWLPYILTTAGIGAVGLGVGTYFGVRTLMLKDERDEICDDSTCPPNSEGLALDADAREAAVWSTVNFAIGGAHVAAAIVLWILDTQRPVAQHLVIAPSTTGGFVAGGFGF